MQDRTRRIMMFEVIALFLLCAGLFLTRTREGEEFAAQAGRFAAGGDISTPSETQKEFIRWVDFTVTCEAMNQAFRYDVDTCQSDPHLNWVDLLACLGAMYGGDFSRYQPSDMDDIAGKLREKTTTVLQLSQSLPSFSYYREAYGAVLDGLIGSFEAEIPARDAPTAYLPTDASGNSLSPDELGTVWVTKYGLKAFSPIAKSFPYSDFDDFGVSRSYGYARRHLGHDMMGQVGTPIIAVESGRIEALGWNQYGGWRIGIRSLDGKRYYYYAHLRKNYPYQSTLKEGDLVQAGDVIGYLGRTGYSATENTNNIEEAHLHFGLELIFDESQKDSENEIWVDCYELTRFLSMNQCETSKVEGTKEWTRVYGQRDL